MNDIEILEITYKYPQKSPLYEALSFKDDNGNWLTITHPTITISSGATVWNSQQPTWTFS